MPEGREGRRAASLFFAFWPLNFLGARGREEAGFGGSLPLAALLVYACQRVGRANKLNLLFFVRAPFNFPGPGARCFQVISTIRGGAFSGYMQTGRDRKRDVQFSFALPALNFDGEGGRGGAGFGGSLPSAEAFLVCECQRVEKGSRLKFGFELAPSNFPGPGGGVFRGSLQSTAALLVDVCRWDRRGNVLNRFFCASAVHFSRSGGG